MGIVHLLDSETINQIAAGEVIERPASIVKELVENSVDSGATIITVDISGGGISSIRVTDNGNGFAAEDIPLAFLRHATSKIRTGNDLLSIQSLGFRGEALSSIAAVSRVELLSKRSEDYLGRRYVIEGGVERCNEEVGCPDGTTFIVRDLFYNVPARRKFLKSAVTEAGYISELMCRFSICHSSIAFTLLINGRTTLHTSGNGNPRDAIYSVYGREIAMNLVPIHAENELFTVDGFLGKPLIARGNRTNENYFVNGRYIRSSLLSKAIEEAYQPYSMQHKYPFTALSFQINPAEIDVNIHPTKTDVRFSNGELLAQTVRSEIGMALKQAILIPDMKLSQETPVNKPIARPPEGFETNRLAATISSESKLSDSLSMHVAETPILEQYHVGPKTPTPQPLTHIPSSEPVKRPTEQVEQLSLFQETEQTKEAFVKEPEDTYRIVGQIFSTYWIVEKDNQLFYIDQHAAHEKILYERTLKELENRENCSQYISPPIVLSLSLREEEVLKQFMQHFETLGFEIASFGGQDYAVQAVPATLFRLTGEDYFHELLDELLTLPKATPSRQVLERVASMSCKSAIKGNQTISEAEAKNLIHELMTLENPYHCPHGRPIIIALSKHELERKFKRII